MKKISIIIFTVIVFACLISCGSGKENTTVDNNETITFRDALDREVTVGNNPKRVVCMLGSFAEVWQLAGGKVVGTAGDAWEDFELDLSDDVVNIGGAHSPNFEIILSASPDFVIASASTSSNVELLDSFEKAGITVGYFDVDNFDDYLKMLDICTDVTGRKDLYMQNGKAIEAEIDGIKARFAALDIAENEKRVLLLRASSTSVKAKGSDGTVLGEMLCDIGCVNIADNQKHLLENLSIEEIMVDQPHHIFVVTMGSDFGAAKENISKLIEKNPAWSDLEAVKNGRIHFMDRKLFNIKPNSRWADAYEILTEIFKTE